MKKTLFVLEAITFEKKRRKNKDDYQAFTTKKYFSAFYERMEDAESGLVQIINNQDYNHLDFYCFYIREIPYKCICYCNWDASYSVWLYDASGKKVDERLYPSYFYGKYFNGRKKEKLRFQVGDVVECNGELCIVVSVPKEHCDGMYDSSDDGYTVIYLEQDFESKNGLCHTHPECIEVMPPRFPISEEVQQKIERVKEWYIGYLKEWEEKYHVTRECEQ